MMTSTTQATHSRIARQVGFQWFRLSELSHVSAKDFAELQTAGLVDVRVINSAGPSIWQYRLLA